MKQGTRAGIAALAAAAYVFGVRPRILRWGATDEEVASEFPGKDIVRGGKRGATMAITIDAPPARVWEWLVQMGVDRGGWYSWDNLDNWSRKSSERVHPEWQKVAVGDRFLAIPDGREWWEVAAAEPERFLCLRMSVDLRGRPFVTTTPRPKHFTDSTWGFELRPVPVGRTRLIVSGYWKMEPAWMQLPFSILVLEPSHWIMQMRQFANIKRRAEREARRDAAKYALCIWLRASHWKWNNRRAVRLTGDTPCIVYWRDSISADN